jgi:translocation and assembly module TamB
MMRRLLHTSWISLLALGLLVAGSIYYVGWTSSGLQRLVSLTNRRIGPVTLEITGARGTLHGGVHADRVVVDHQRVHIVAQQVDGRVALLPLLWQTIRVRHLTVADVSIHVLPHHAQGGAPWQPHFLVGLLDIQADDLNVGHVTVIAPSGASIAGDQAHAVAQIGTHEIRIFDSKLNYSGFEVRSVGTLQAADPIGMKGEIRLSLDAPDQPSWLANTQIDGDLNLLEISGVLLSPFNADFHGDARALSGDWHWQGSSVVRDFDLQAWQAGDALGEISGTLQLSGDRSGVRATGMLDAEGLRAGPIAVDFAGNYAARVLDVARVTLLHRASGAQLSATGSIGIVAGGPRLDLQGQWRNFRWPLTDAAAAVHSGTGSFTLSGLRPYAFTAAGALQVRSQPPLQVRAAGRLAHDGVSITDAVVDAYGGQAQVRADLRWSPQERWSVDGTMRGLNIASLRPTISGRLNFLVAAAGQGFGPGRSLQARFTDIGGNVRGQRASGHAGIALAGDDWLLQQVQLRLGATRLEADGRIGARTDVRFAVDAEDLALLHAGARGRLHAEGHFRGDQHNPMLQARISGAQLQYQDISLRTVDASIDFDPRGSGHAESDIRVEQLSMANHQIDQARFTTTGTAAAHRFTMQLRATPFSVKASGTASFSDGVWRADFAEFKASDGAGVQLELAAPAALVAALNGEELRLERFCLHDALATLCAAGSRTLGNSQFNVSAANVPLRTLTAGVSSATDFDGRVSLEAHGARQSTGPWSGALKGTLVDAGLRHHLRGGRVESFNLGGGNVQAALDGAGLSASVLLDAGAAGSIAGRLAARSNGEALTGWPLSGELRLQTESIGFIDSYVGQVDRVSGHLDANLTLAGSLAAPRLNGELKVSGGEVDAYQINLALRDVNFDARLHDTVLQFGGNAKAGADGHAEFSGELAWRDALPYGQLHLSGENLRIVNIPEARVQASPDVNMKFTGRRIDVVGTVTLPYARLQRSDQLTNAVRASSDEVLVSAAQASPSERFHVFSDLTLRLGERVTIDTLGLNGRLSGSLRTVADDSGFNRATGELQVEEGKYTAYGRKLDIERGRLRYSNGPLNDPAIDLRAIKKFPDITAGVNVRGTLREPRMTFFSDPAVSQSQIVSLLLAGGSLESVQNADPAQRGSAARNNMLLQGSALLFQQFGGKVGLDDVSVESGLNNDTSLVLGRYLSPRLYISYGISLAEAINTIKMRYTIGDHWTIKTEAGTARSADLVYTIER